MQKSPTRRTFLLTLGSIGAAAATVGGWQYTRSNRSLTDSSPQLQSASRTARALGSEISILVLHENSATANTALDAAFAELARIEAVMSLYRPDSQVSQLNRTGTLQNPDPYLVEILQHAAAMSRLSDGAFDITVQPLWSLYATAAKFNTLPADAALHAARQSINWQNVSLAKHQVRLLAPNMAITLNGIAQGFAADKLMLALKSRGIQNALVNAGEIAATGHKASGAPWVTGIQHPRQADAYLGLAKLEEVGGADRCVSTSGDYQTAFTPDKSANHIFNPQTGRSPSELSSVTIVAPTATQADALSTAIFVLGPDKGLALAASLSNIDALLVTKSNQTFATKGFPWNA